MNPIKEALEEVPAQPQNDGYLYVTLDTNDGNCHTYRVDQLVWTTFKGPIPSGYYIDHIDGNLHNNDVHNLRLLKR
jgi:hypothetical protein